LVEDEANLRYSLTRALESETLEIVTAATARRGIDLVAREPFDAVLLDLRLPDMHGTQVLRQMRLLRPDLPVILVTPFSGTLTERDARAQGAVALLPKPIDLRHLRAVVRRAIGQKATDRSAAPRPADRGRTPAPVLVEI